MAIDQTYEELETQMGSEVTPDVVQDEQGLGSSVEKIYERS